MLIFKNKKIDNSENSQNEVFEESHISFTKFPDRDTIYYDDDGNEITSNPANFNLTGRFYLDDESKQLQYGSMVLFIWIPIR